jgi:FKBP-type peptidyl-prolyl cis-trans isomerase FklB
MKKINIILSVVILMAVAFSSCSEYKAKSVKLKNELDSLSYAFGYSNGKILKDYHLNNDSTGEGFKSLMKGIEEALNEKTDDNEKVAGVTEMGKAIGNQLRTTENFFGDSTITTNYKLIRQGLINGISKFEDGMTAQNAQEYFNNTMQALQEARVEKDFKANKDAGIAFLKENGAKEDVMTTASGLQYKVVSAGKKNAPTPAATDRVKVHYHGTLIDGTVFDSSVQRGTPAEFGLNQVIKGWTEGLQLMPVGSKYMLYVPQELGYGAQNQGAIQPFSTLIFEVELLEILK